LELGVFDGTHGWLRIRAELGTGGAVNASLTTNAAAHESLRVALPALADYLRAEAIGVDKIAVYRTTDSSSAMSTAQGEPNNATGQNRHDHPETHRDAGALKSSAAVADQDTGHLPSAQISCAETESTQSPAALSKGSGNNWLQGLARVMPQFGSPFAFFAGVSGSWVNVSA